MRVQIINRERGKNAELGKAMASALSEEMEKLARQEAAKNGFDVSKEQNGLFRAIMHVMTKPELMAEAKRRAKARLEGEGVLPKEDPKIVVHK